MKVLVTGSEGFLGKHLVDELNHLGYEVVRYDLELGLDILNIEQLRHNLIGCDVCVHLAAIADLYIAEEEPEIAQMINVEGTRKIVNVCDELGVRLLYASTCCAYGNNHVEISNEESPVAPTEHYAKTKLEGEKHVLNSKNGHTVMRIATFYGPGMRSSLATAIFLNSAFQKEEINIHGDGTQTRCFTHVSDISSGIICLIQNNNFEGIVNVSDDKETSVNELAKIAINISGNDVEISYQPERDGQIFRSSIDNSLLRGMGWKPKWSLEDGLNQCASVYKTEVLT